MREILSQFLYRFLGDYHNIEDTFWLFGDDNGGSGMYWGFFVLLGVSALGSAFFYFGIAKEARKATMANWFKMMVFTAIAVFVLEELVLAGTYTAFQEEVGIGVFSRNLTADGGRLVLFSFINAIYSTVVYYLCSVLLFSRFSDNAKYIPHKKRS